MASVRVRVTAIAAVLVAVVLVAASVVLLQMQRARLTENLDNTLRLRVDSLVAEAGTADDPSNSAPDPVRLTESVREGEVGVLQIVADDGRVVAASYNAAGDPPLTSSPAPGTEAFTNVPELPLDDDPFRIFSRTVDANGNSFTFHAAASRDPIEESLTELRNGLGVVLPLVVALLSLLIWTLVGRTLRPIEAVRREVADMGGAELHRRVPVPPTDDEVGRLARTMNGLLDRIEQSSIRQQRFVSDASHELRSPLTRMRSELEVDLTHPESADPTATHRSVLDETVNLQHLVEDLLHLAQSDAGATATTIEPVDLDDLVLSEARRLRARSRNRIDTASVAAGQVRGDPAQLRRVVRNLAENADRHARSTVAFTVVESAGTVELCVTDDGPGVPEAEREAVFERFRRLDASRSATTGGTGLGLSIVKDIVLRHDGTVYVGPNDPSGARFVVTLPT